jgi:hypothetical protein
VPVPLSAYGLTAYYLNQSPFTITTPLIVPLKYNDLIL